MTTNQKILDVNETQLCAESFGDLVQQPSILLIHGAGESLLAWEEEFIERLVAGGRSVIRYDSRDAGRSATYPVGAPPYCLRDLVTDAVGLLDAFGLRKAHLMGMSQGSAVAQLVALDHPDRVASLTLTSSTPGGPGHQYPDLPEMTPELEAFFAGATAEPDWTDRAAVVEYLAEADRPFTAPSQPFDTVARRVKAGRIVDRANDIAAQLTNPFLIDAGAPWRDRLAEISAPTLVLHGTEDPLFPIGHGRALAEEIPGAHFLAMEHTGHEIVPRAQWNSVLPAILARTA
ncbi:alpha/beta fold hydrolase [Nocardia sp. GCM10030253]|uniref:alpha/beta fold hydrolase n=1 Tax=Nocardia sp. GCM10030253 TaxID=3273404 RepID=UPI003640EB83